MSGLEIVFLIVAAMTLSAAFMVVTTQNLVHGALWLVLTLFGVAATFVLLNATFLAVVQVVVYIGAIAILLIFAIMLTRKVMQDSTSQTNANWIVAALLGLVLFVGIAQLLRKSSAVGIMMPAMDAAVDPVVQLGEVLVSPNAYVLPFEVASVLLLAALIGSIVVAWKK